MISKLSLVIVAIALFMGLCIGLASADVIMIENTQGNIVRSCFNNNNYCASSFLCNLTVSKVHGSVVINNQRMTYNPTFYNYSYIFTDIGDYNAVMICSNGTDAGEDTFPIVVNTSGSISTLQKILSSMFAIIVMAGLAGFLIFAVVKIVTFPPLKYSLGIIAALIIFIILNLSITLMRDEIGNSSLIGFFDSFAAMSVWLYYFGIGMILVIWIITFVINIMSKNTQQRQQKVIGI